MKKSLAIILSFTIMGSAALLYSRNQVSAEDTAPAAEQTEQTEKDPVRVRYQYLLTRGREEILAMDSRFDLFPEFVQFAIDDINGDGTEDLLIHDKLHKIVHVADTDKNEVGEFAGTVAFYPDGTAARILTSTRKLTSSFVPYEVYKYNKDTNKYESVGTVDAWEKSAKPKDASGNPFPDDIDKSGKGIVYYLDGSDTPVDKSEYEAWRSKQLPALGQMTLSYLPLTQDNINNIDTTPRNVPAVTTTEAITTPEVTTTSTAETTTVTTTEAVTEAVTTAVTTTVTTTAPEPEFENSQYDIDGNSVINTSDIVKLSHILIAPEKFPDLKDKADLNSNGSVGVSDLLTLIRFMKQ
ncbi:dockerin type I domain-containing protein [Ruminococcus sp. HUN007]|uniref:dockerin type I domain-containing protein n=1 Tax=Ruminococcus sp. HUN007 TaxID=1514668 RepID=UPI0005D2C2C5|nr:dockerin type I domain-containing protein [Ruminococcus sp. HUN007]